MGKRTKTKYMRSPRDAYYTKDIDAAKILGPSVDDLSYIEPCAGAGDLVNGLKEYSTAWCAGMYDLDPMSKDVVQRNCLTLTEDDLVNVDCFITNPPFSWIMLKPILEHLPKLRPTWMLLPADLMHNVRTSPYVQTCEYILSIGRMYWTPNKVKGKDNYAWYLFTDKRQETIFVPRL